MNGKDYRALRRLSTIDDATLAKPGETCERVPVDSLPLLLASGKIEPVQKASENYSAATPRDQVDKVFGDAKSQTDRRKGGV
jgi:hypothetical protein